jgi:uncharacterized membrane protein HdeD (DUF308 family)
MMVPAMVQDLSRDWKTIVLRGAVVAIFGLLFLFFPAFSLEAGTYALAGFALVYGLLALFSGLRSSSDSKILMIVEGVVGIGLGLLAFSRPGTVVKWMIYAIAVWALVSGVIQIFEAIRLRKEIESEWLLALAGACSVVFGIIAFAVPGDAARTLTMVLGIYALVFGGLLIALGFKVKDAAARLQSAATEVAARMATR